MNDNLNKTKVNTAGEASNKSDSDLDDLFLHEEEMFKRFLEKSKNPAAYEKSAAAVKAEKTPASKKERKSFSINIKNKPAENTDYDKDGDIIIHSLKDMFPDMTSYMQSDPNGSVLYKIKEFLKCICQKDNARKISCLLIPGFLTLLLVLNLLAPADKISEMENRTLAQFPDISFTSLTDGSFMTGFESYVSDQFVFRNSFVSMKRRYERMTGKKENHDILMCKDNYLIENASELTYDNIDSNIKAIGDLAAVSRYNITLAVVPSAYEIMKDKLPAFAYSNVYGDIQNRLNAAFKDQKNVTVADTKQTLEKHKNEYIYYRTDHHQAALGSYWTYNALGKALSYEPYGLEHFKRETKSEDFCGTTWSNSGFPSTEADSIFKYTLDKGFKASVSFPADNEKLDTLYNEKKLSTKDKYSYYLDGNHALSVIKSNCKTGKKLAVIKDSYAHSLAPFLANHYSEIYMIDMRYFTDDIFEYLYSNGIKDVLMLYNQNMFMTDNNLAKITAFSKTSTYTNVPDVSYGVVPELDKVDDSYFDDAVFIGDSLTMGIKFFSGLNSTFICQTGLNTQKLENSALDSGKTVIETLRDMDKVGKIYIMLGTNEISYNDPEGYLKRYSSFIDRVKEEMPGTLIYIESIMPVSQAKSSSSTIKNDTVKKFNEKLIELAKEKECYYIDSNSKFAGEDGYLPAADSSDGIHLNPSGYRELTEYFKTHAVGVGSNKKMTKTVKKVFKGGGKYDTVKIAENVLSAVKFKDKLAKVSDTLTVSNYNPDTKTICSAALYLGGGSTAEEIAVFEADSEKSAKALVEKVKKRIENKKNDYRTYMPAEMTKLNSPVIVQKGNIVVVCIADKVDEATVTKCIKK